MKVSYIIYHDKLSPKETIKTENFDLNVILMSILILRRVFKRAEKYNLAPYKSSIINIKYK